MNEKLLYPSSFKILMVDDEPPFLRSLSITLERLGGINNLQRCTDSREVMEILSAGEVGLVLLDLNMPHVSGKELLEKIKENRPEIGVIIISGINQIELAVECIRKGAFDYYVKTSEEDRLVRGVLRAVRMIEMQKEHREIRDRLLLDNLEHPETFSEILTDEKSMRAIFQYLESVASSTQPILITGESGVGKELFARAAHTLSGARGPLISINVAGLDDNIFSDTLFGHRAGAFTGAEKDRPGMIEQAENGTLFLDEIGDLSIPSQVKLLRLLQNGEYYPLGSDRPRRMKSRIVVATHRDLTENRSSGAFREDLYYRLCTHHVHIPPLRERKEDIPLLLNHFMEKTARSLGKKMPSYPKELLVLLSNYGFPGNVRQLQAMVHDAVSVHKSRVLSLETFKRKMGVMTGVRKTRGGPDEDACGSNIFVPTEPLPHIHEIADLLVNEAMKRAKGNQSIACRLIGISQPALSKRLKKLKT